MENNLYLCLVLKRKDVSRIKRQKMIKRFLQRRWPLLVGLLLGGIAGYLYNVYVGCASGTCMITSSPYLSTLWGAALGGLLVDGFRPCSGRGGSCHE